MWNGHSFLIYCTFGWGPNFSMKSELTVNVSAAVLYYLETGVYFHIWYLKIPFPLVFIFIYAEVAFFWFLPEATNMWSGKEGDLLA